jgi:hypothetical protein
MRRAGRWLAPEDSGRKTGGEYIGTAMKSAFLIPVFAVSFLLNGCQSTPVVSNGVTAAAITVTFKDSDKFTDVRDTMGGQTVPRYLDILSDHLKKTAPAFLQSGQKLAVTFNDIDLAGDFLPGPRAGAQDIRIIKPIYRPRMELNFEVRDASDKVVKDGPRTLIDLNFQFDSTNIMVRGNEELAYDKLLLTHWLEKEFPK